MLHGPDSRSCSQDVISQDLYSEHTSIVIANFAGRRVVAQGDP